MKYEEAMICDGCILPICDSYYSCENCNYFLHASCAQLPEEFQHPRHLQHPLVLRKFQRSFSYFECSLCKLRCNGFLYNCTVCQFCLDLKCAMLDTVSVIMHEAHPHQLVQHEDSMGAACKSCRQNIYGPSFRCGDCEFCLHYKCTLLPRYINHFDSFRVYKRDDHPLTLMYPPFSDHPDEFYCEICEEEIHPRHWLYHCLECDGSFHSYCIVELGKYQNIKFGATLRVLNHRHALKFIIRGGFTPFCECCDGDLYCEMAFECRDCNYYLCYTCGISSQDFGSSIFKSSVDNMEMIVADDSNSVFEDEGKVHNSINFLPASDISLELMVRHFLKSCGITESQLSEKIKHFSHSHPLNLFINDAEDVNALKNEEILVCDGCVRPISVHPYYGCKECNYFLHAYCAQLSNKIVIQHPYHSQHSLVLTKNPIYEVCDICWSGCNGFLFECQEKCRFRLDIHCAILTATNNFAKHEAHCHQLVLTIVGNEFWCNACGDITGGRAFGCDDCGFHLHDSCALLPRFARHVKDEHPLILSCRSFRQHPRVIYCGSCKEKIYTIHWFYCCSECNQSFHPHCVISKIFDRRFRNVKFGGIFEMLRFHHHALKFVRKDAFSCNCCYNPRPLDVAYECEPCGFYICLNCAEVQEQGIEQVGSSST